MSSEIRQGLRSPVRTPQQPDWNQSCAGATTYQLADLSDEQLAEVDPLIVNLIVAREIPGLADLDVASYQQRVNSAAADFANRYLPYWRQSFQHEPHCYLNDERFFRVGMICQYVREVLGVGYKPEQMELRRVRYLDPGDLFLHGVVDTLAGTCGNMPTLALAIGWRMGWAVSLACVRSHHILRYDDGDAIFNFEITTPMEGGFNSPADHHIIENHNIPPAALKSGSDLRALTARERLGLFVGLRARHLRDLAIERRDTSLLRLAERDYLLARHLFPAQRVLNCELAFLTALFAGERFDPHEAPHWRNYGLLAQEVSKFLRGVHPAQRPIGLLDQKAAADG